MALLIKTTRPFLGLVSKAKAAKLVRTLVELFLDMEAGTGEEVNEFSLFITFHHRIIQISLCQENIEWAKSENRTFLRQDLEVFSFLKKSFRYKNELFRHDWLHYIMIQKNTMKH